MIYHIYNRGAHKAPIFHDSSDYQRFLYLLYLANSNRPVRLFDKHESIIFLINRGETIVTILAYCLMPNHFHLVIKEEVEGQATRFVRKVCTGYSMYYNLKYRHSGTLFQGKMKKKYVEDDRYLSTLIQYVHLNPYGLEVPHALSEVKYENYTEATRISSTYDYSSFKDYLGKNRSQSSILAPARSDLADIS